MGRLDVHPMPGREPGYVVDIQADLLSRLATRTVVPLVPEGMAPPSIGELNPTFEVKGKRHMLIPPVPCRSANPRAEATRRV